MSRDEIVNTLSALIKVCNNSSDGFKACVEHAEIGSPKLQAMLRERQREWASASEALRALVLEQGVDPATAPTAEDNTHRGWLDVRAAVFRKKDLAVLEECERGEDTAKDAYRRALVVGLPSPIRAILEQQYHGVLRTQELIKNLRDEEKHAYS